MGEGDEKKGDERKGLTLRTFAYILYVCVVVIIIAPVTGFAVSILFAGKKPKPPIYNLQTFIVKSFDHKSNNSIKTEFFVEIKTTNPNEYFGFSYDDYNNVSVLYNDVVISSGMFESFNQYPSAINLVNMKLEGMIDPKSRLQDDVKSSKGKGGIPLLLNLEVPMHVNSGIDRIIKGFMAYVKCDLMVNGLEKGNKAKVSKKECQTHIKI